jgi:hypothetical protein
MHLRFPHHHARTRRTVSLINARAVLLVTAPYSVIAVHIVLVISTIWGLDQDAKRPVNARKARART